MRQLFVSLVSLSPYPALLDRQRALALYVSALIFGISRLVLLIPGMLERTADLMQTSQTAAALIQVPLLGGVVLAWGLTRRGELRAAAGILTALMLVGGLFFALGRDWNAPEGWIALWLGVATAGLLLHPRESAAIAACAGVILVAGAFHDFGNLSGDERAGRVGMALAALLWTAGLAALTTLVAYGAQRAARRSYVQDRAQHLIEIGQLAAQGLFDRANPKDILNQAAAAIERDFEAVHHVQIYVVEPGSPFAVLQAATGPAGERLLAQEHRLDVGGLSVVGRVTLNRMPLHIPDMHADPIHKPHPLLPAMRTELAIPLLANAKVIGALDVQSQHVNAFDQGDTALLQAIARQIAVTLEGLHIHDAAQRSQRENQALIKQTQTSLREIEHLNYQLTGRAWSDYLHLQAESTAMTLDFDSGQTTATADWTSTLQQAMAQHEAITTDGSDHKIVALPIIVRNEVIGAMEFELAPDADLPDGVMELIGAVGQRLGMAMENRRLLDETQRVAQREALLNDISADLQAATGVDAIIQRAARHLQETLAAQQVTIRLGPAPSSNGASRERSQG